MIDLKSQRQELETKKKKGIIEEELQRFGAKEEEIKITRELIEEEKALLRGALSVRDLISPASFKVSPTFLALGQKFLRTIFVITYPRYISVGWFAPIINLNECFDVSMLFYPVKSAIILKQLKSRVGNLEVKIMSDTEKSVQRDLINKTA